MQCLANLTMTRQGVKAALQADLPISITDIMKQVSADTGKYVHRPFAASATDIRAALQCTIELD